MHRRFFPPLLAAAFLTSAIRTVHSEEIDGTELPISSLLESYCWKCHDEDVQKGDLRLDGYSTEKQVLTDRKVWLKVLEQLETREMPTKAPFPTEEEYEHLIDWVDETINNVDWDSIDHPGHVTLPRLTKREYNNTMRDLLGIDMQPGREFLEDGEGESGFTNDRDGLFVTASQLEKYFSAAERAMDALIALNSPPVTRVFESEDMFMTESKMNPDKFDGDSLGYTLSRGQMTLYDSVEIPKDGFYRFRVRLRSTTYGPAGATLRLDDEKAGEVRTMGRSPAEKDIYAFVSRGEHQMAWNVIHVAPIGRSKERAAYPDLPDDAAKIISQESVSRAPTFPRTGKETARQEQLLSMFDGRHRNVQRAYEWLRLHGPTGNPSEHARFIGYVEDRMKTVAEVAPSAAAELGISSGEFEKRFRDANSEKLADREHLQEVATGLFALQEGNVAIDRITVSGPVLPPGAGDQAEKLTSLFLESDLSATNPEIRTNVFREFLSTAFRGPVSTSEVARYAAIYDEARERGILHAEALKQCFSAILVSPRFLYRVEKPEDESAEGAFDLDDYELASRLSYGLWLTMPDETLISLAENGQLSQRSELEKQVDRMTADPRFSEFISSFAGQWLGYSSLGVSEFPDVIRFPQFTPDLNTAMKAETELWFAEVFRGNRSLLELIDAKETYLNRSLARHYGISDVTGLKMEKVSLKDRRRGGILGMGSVLTATSTPVRTSPVLRGVWVMERILGEDPGEPLPNAGELPGNAGAARGKTLREELEIHRDKDECASCHDSIDPLGFGLEQFDAIGRFRLQEGKKPIDATGILPDGTEFNGVVELKDYIVTERRDDFVRVVAERLLSFLLGRDLQYYDESAIRHMVDSAKKDEYRAKALLKAAILSDPFRRQHPEIELP